MVELQKSVEDRVRIVSNENLIRSDAVVPDAASGLVGSGQCPEADRLYVWRRLLKRAPFADRRRTKGLIHALNFLVQLRLDIS